MCFFGGGNEFKDVVGELASYVVSRDFSRARVAAVALSNLESPIFKKPKQQKYVIPLNTRKRWVHTLTKRKSGMLEYVSGRKTTL